MQQKAEHLPLTQLLKGAAGIVFAEFAHLPQIFGLRSPAQGFGFDENEILLVGLGLNIHKGSGLVAGPRFLL